MFTRRGFVASALASAALAGASVASARRALGAHADDESRPTIGLGFSLYGMKSLALPDAIAACAEIGYDAIELPVMPGWPGDCEKLSADARRDLVAQLSDRKLRLAALMENLPALGDDPQHAANLQRLKRACELAANLVHDSHVPIVETVMGGKAGEFDAARERLADRLTAWAKIAEAARVKLAVKAHVSNATQRPEQLIWLVEKVASPYLTAAYDYSHFQLQDLKLDQTLAAVLPHASFIHLKDTEHGRGGRGFLLPGEGTIDYGEYFGLLAASRYRGDVVVEVSGQVFGKPGYEPRAAARKCYNHLAAALKAARIERK